MTFFFFISPNFVEKRVLVGLNMLKIMSNFDTALIKVTAYTIKLTEVQA